MRKKNKLLEIKKILQETAPEKERWKWTPMDLVTYYQIKEMKIWEIVKDEKAK